MFKWRLESRDFQPVLDQWWKHKNFPSLPKELLPERIYIVSDENGSDLFAIPTYTTDSQFVWMGFPTGSPKSEELNREDKDKAINFLLGVIETTLKYNGFSRVITTSMHPTIMKNLEDREFAKTDVGTNFYIKILE